MDSLEAVLEALKAGKSLPLTLFWGEEYLVRQSADTLIQALLPNASAGLNLMVMTTASAREVATELAMLPLFPGTKVVYVQDPDFLAPKKSRGDGLAKARDAWKAGKRKEGARRVLGLAARAGWGAQDLDPTRSGAPSVSQWGDELGVALADADIAFLKEVAVFCREEKISAPDTDAGPLVELLEKGLPSGHSLIIATSEVDTKDPLLKWAQKKAVVIEKKVASRLKDLDVTDVVQSTLGPLRKRLAKDAQDLLKDRCGGNMRLLQSELEKLALYTEKDVISASDVELLVGHAREEEFLELSDSLQKRDLAAALSYAEHAMSQGSHPLLLLGATASIIRTLIENHGRLEAFARGSVPRSFDEFKRSVFPRIEEEAKALGARVPHPYAAFLGMQAAARYTRSELLGALVACADADLALKTSASGRLTLERVLWTLCQPKREARTG